MLTQSQLAAAVAERADLSRADAKNVLAALETVVLEQLGEAERVKIGGLVQLTVRLKPAQKARKGRNPATGEEITMPPRRPVWTCALGSSLERRTRCRHCRRRAVDSNHRPDLPWLESGGWFPDNCPPRRSSEPQHFLSGCGNPAAEGFAPRAGGANMFVHRRGTEPQRARPEV